MKKSRIFWGSASIYKLLHRKHLRNSDNLKALTPKKAKAAREVFELAQKIEVQRV